MPSSILQFAKRIFQAPDLRRKVIVTAVVLIIYRLLAHIPASGIDVTSIKALFQGSPLLSLLDVFSGGTLANFSILALGLTPYINASIVIQLMTYIVPKLEELSKEGDYGQEKINQYTRMLTVPLAVVQSFGMYSLLKGQGIIPQLEVASLVVLVLNMAAGTMISVWLGELITEYGVSNGISFLIFAGIVARLPITFGQSLSVINSSDFLKVGLFGLISLLVIGFIVFMSEATRRIPINYARQSGRGAMASSYLPLRINQAGVIPIIFAVSLMIIPSFLTQFLASSQNLRLAEFSVFLTNSFNPNSFLYNALYFLLVVGFTYFYTAIVFDPEKISENLKKGGGYITGIRPGEQTRNYLNMILKRITLVGAVFLGFIAVLPSFFVNFIGISNMAIGGTGVLIVVSVVLELIRELESKMVMKKYNSYL